MNIGSAIEFSFKNVLAHPFRTLLTMFGIVLGVSSLVSMSAMIKGMEKGMKESMIAMGGLDKVIISEDGIPSSMDHLSDMAPGKTFRDVYALRENASLVKIVSPELSTYDRRISYQGKAMRPSELVGVWPDVLEMNLFDIEHGRFFSDLDDQLALSVCVIGTGVRDKLFGKPISPELGAVPLGEWVKINGQPFKVIGMFKHYESETDRRMRQLEAKRKKSSQPGEAGPARERGWSGAQTYGNAFWRKNNTVYIPINTMKLKFPQYLDSEEDDGVLIPDKRLSDIDVKVKSMETMEIALQQVKNVLGITHYGILDYEFRTRQSSIEDINKRIKNSRLSGSIIAGLSLLVGGIGIMNIMFASIQERIREIGTCKAIGASGYDVFIQVVLESIMVSLLGAMAGIGFSFWVVELLVWLAPSQNAPIITPEAMMNACGFSIIIGMMAGLFPAIKAAKMSPIEALKY